MNMVYGEPVNVQARDDGRPVRFVWRGRLYTVRAILEHWLINREWWQEPGAPGPWRAGPARPEQEPGVPGPSGAGPARPELEFWRVEASPGPGMTATIYELRREAATEAWTLRTH